MAGKFFTGGAIIKGGSIVLLAGRWHVKKPCLYILCGLPFAGKTTLAKILEKSGIAGRRLD
jgi:ABC-type molybdenum transport system ATPase subunit/photorepair protein PhrA